MIIYLCALSPQFLTIDSARCKASKVTFGARLENFLRIATNASSTLLSRRKMRVSELVS